MSTVRPILDQRYKSKDGTYPVIVRIKHKGRPKDLATGYKILPRYWAGNKAVRHPDATLINSRIDELVSKAKAYLADCQRTGRPVRLDRVLEENNSYSFNDYLLHRAKQYEKNEKFVMKRKVTRFEFEIRENFGNIGFDELNGDKMREYDAWLKKRGNKDNTRHKKYKFLGEFYHQAVEEGKALLPNPFKAYKINKKPVFKEKLTLAELKELEDLKLKPGPVNDARNLALFSYYCKGNRFEICITFERDKIMNGRCYFKTNKGEKYVSVKIHTRLQNIIDQYPGDGRFLFPYIKELPNDKEKYIKKIDSLNTIVNRNLKIAVGLTEIKKDVTFHIMRHTFAMHLKMVTPNIHIIQQSLGHSDQKTTAMYLASLDDEALDSEIDKVYGG